jgi:TonB family protein
VNLLVNYSNGQSGPALSFLLAVTLKTTIVLALAWILAVALHSRSAAVRHAVWTASILSSLLLPILTLLLPSWRSPQIGNLVGHWSAPRPILAALEPSTLSAMSIDAVANASLFSNLPPLIVSVWALGVFLLALKLAAGIVRLATKDANCTPLIGDAWNRFVPELSTKFELTRPVLLMAPIRSRPMPVTWGILRPRILLPADAGGWTDERKRIVIAHELAHVRRHDWLWQICAELLRTFGWFHPLAWVAAAKLRHESERACDDCVLNSGIAASDYANQLLDLARTLGNSRHGWTTALAVARPSSLERRLVAMLNPSINRHRLSRATRLAVPVLATCLLLPLAAIGLPAQDLPAVFTGSVYDASGTAVRNATIIMHNPATNTTEMTTTDADGKFNFKSLPAGQFELGILKRGFEEYRAPQTLMSGRESSTSASLKVGAMMEEIDVVPEGAAKTLPESETAGMPSRLRMGGDVQAAKLVTKVQPLYPATARTAGIQGTVILHAVVGLDGRPLSLRVMNKDVDPDLARASVEAVSQWRYQPTLLNGKPVEVDTTIEVKFTLAT